MTRLSPAARATLTDAGVTQAEWARANYWTDARWQGDVCGCPDNRCNGYHHYAGDDCGCLALLLTDYLTARSLREAAPCPAG